jgi:hypothetical protein
MKIPESIIEKYQLTPSGEQTGESFIYNQLLYKSNIPELKLIIFMECDLSGKPAKEVCFYNKKTKFWGAITPQLLNVATLDHIIKIVTER